MRPGTVACRRLRQGGVFATALVIVMATTVTAPAVADHGCRYVPGRGALVCHVSGSEPGPGPGGGGSTRPLRYVYVSTDAAGDSCHYWSARPGGLDAWDPANDPAVIAITTGLPRCPAERSIGKTEIEARVWEVIRSFHLAAPRPRLEPPDVGITGLPAVLSTTAPRSIVHTEALPDGRSLRVQARVTSLSVDWGDGAMSFHDPGAALPYPKGSVDHTYRMKTCSVAYRLGHPSGANCHPDLEYYTLAVTYTWTAGYSVGRGWVEVGSLDRTAAADYDVDEVVGLLIP